MDNDAMLSTFQEITNTEDTQFAEEILERLNWDLELAANHVFSFGHVLPDEVIVVNVYYPALDFRIINNCDVHRLVKNDTVST